MNDNYQDFDSRTIDTDPIIENIDFNRIEGDTTPPGARRKFEEPAPSPDIDDEEIKAQQHDQARAREFVEGRIPLHPAVIRLPASVFGRLASEISGYEGFSFTQEELDDLASLWMACGVEANPRLQAMVGSIAMLGVKAGGYTVWRRQGSSGDIRNARRRGFQE